MSSSPEDVRYWAVITLWGANYPCSPFFQTVAQAKAWCAEHIGGHYDAILPVRNWREFVKVAGVRTVEPNNKPATRA